MTELPFLIAAGGTILVGILHAIPAIIWSFRCDAMSPHYRCPRTPRLRGVRIGTLLVLRTAVERDFEQIERVK
jgi:hypothetical protein